MADNPLIRKFDIGTQIIDTLIDQDGQIIDLAPTSLRQMVFRKTDGSLLTKTASLLTDGADGKLVYTVISGDLDQIGKWVQQSYIELPTGKWRGRLNPFTVHPNLSGSASVPPVTVDFTGTNNDSVTIFKGQPLAVGIVRASAADDTKNAVGLAGETALSGASIPVQAGGTVSQADWTAVTGTTLLSPGFDYFLSVASGLLSLSQPVVSGQIVQPVGTALSTTTMLVEIDTPILL